MSSSLIERIWARDGSAWTDDPAGQRFIPSALGWLDAPAQTLANRGPLEALASQARVEGIQDVVLLGMGGSSLCPEVLRSVFGSTPDSPRFRMLDTTHPDAIAAAESAIDLTRALFLVASKSGGTIETASLMHYFLGRVAEVRGEPAGRSFVALTDPGTSLERLARERGFRAVLRTPAEVGGRYSALTPFGMAPAALLGLDIQDLLQRALGMIEACKASDSEHNPGLALGNFLGENALAGRDKVTLLLPPELVSFGLWIEQLLAESTGKEGKGLIPIADEPLGQPGVYGRDRAFVQMSVRGQEDEQRAEAARVLSEAGFPLLKIELSELSELGAEFFRWELATAVAGAMLRINAFDQPNVQESKDRTGEVLADFQRTGALPTVASASDSEVLSLLQAARANDYIAIMAYVPPSKDFEASISPLRLALRDGRQLATTFGYGPRFLHSTGQLHKGGPNTGVFIQLVSRPTRDMPIPGQPYGFATLIAAQSLGDLGALQAHGRRVVRIELGERPELGVTRLLELVVGAHAKLSQGERE